MAILAFALLLISITKILLVICCKNKLEIKRIIDSHSIIVDSPPGMLAALLTIDGLIGLFCSIYLLTVVL